MRRSILSEMKKDLPTVLHIIPGLGTGGAEHALAALITAKRMQPFFQVVVNLLGSSAGDSPIAEAIRKAGIPIHQFN